MKNTDLFDRLFRWLGGILAGILILALLVGISYRDALQNGFHFDDRDNIVDHPSVHMKVFDLPSLALAWSQPLLANRPLPSLTFAVDWWRGHGQPQAFQETNLLLHIINAVLVFLLLRVVSRISRGAAPPTGARAGLAILLGAALWALNPIQVQAVTYIVQRMAELAAMFSLVSVLCYIQWRTAAHHRWLWLVGMLTAFVLGAVSKENAWITPGLWWLAEFGLCRGARPLFGKRTNMILFALPFLIAFYVVMDISSGTGPLAQRFLPGYAIRDFSLAERLLTQPRVVIFHISQTLLPAPGRFSVEHDYTLSSSLFDPPSTALALAVILAWCAAGLAALISIKHRRTGFWMLWIPLTLVIESSAVPLEMLFEHRMYLPSIGFAGLAAQVLSSPRLDSRLAVGFGAAALLALLWITPQQVRVWRSDFSLYENAVRVAPMSARAWTSYGGELVKFGRTEEAKKVLQHAIQLNPKNYVTWDSLGVIYMDTDDLASAALALRKAYQLGGANHTTVNHIGELYLKMGNAAAAADRFSAAAKKLPDEPVYRWNLAFALEKLGDCRTAREQWQIYLQLENDPVERAKVEIHLAEGCAN
ncbi:MAG: tetratricopeptide repeat protein [Sulfuricella sp.]